MNPTTIRISDAVELFLGQTDNTATDIAREAINKEFYNQMAGVCAKCGDVVFISDGHTNVGSTSPLGMAINPPEPVVEFNLCAECSKEGYDLVSQNDPDPFELEFLEEQSGFRYAAIREAVADLGEEDRIEWRHVGPSMDDKPEPLKAANGRLDEQLLADLITWASWKESVDKSPSDGLQSPVEFTVERLLSQWSNESIEFMYQNVLINDLIEDGTIPETAEEAIKMK